MTPTVASMVVPMDLMQEWQTSCNRDAMATKKAAGKATKKASSEKDTVERVMHEFKEGSLKSGSGAKVKSRKQAIAIGLSEARESGADIPPNPASAKKS